MSFLYTIFLPALAAAAIPVLLHFFSRQRLPVIDFSSLEFLLKLQKRQARRVQLRQIILLILRTLAILALVMAFIRPALKSNAGGGGATSSTEMVIILDDALSSAAETRSGSIYQMEVDYLESLAGLVGANDRATIIRSSEPTNPLSRTATELAVLTNELREREPQLFKPKFSFALAHADNIFKATERFNRELYIVSPYFGAGFDSLTVPTFDKVRCYLVPVGPEELPNASVESITLVSALRQKGRPVDLNATIRNYSKKAVEALPISLYLGNDRVAQGSVDLPAEGSVVKNFTFTLSEAGLLAGSVRLEDPDPFPFDNKRHFVLDVPEKLRLLVVAADSLELAILKSVFDSGPEHYFDLTLRLSRSWETEPLGSFDGIILADVATISSGAVQRVDEFVQAGGGVILLPGRSTDLADWSRGILDRLGFRAVSGVTTGGVKWGKFDHQHPLFFGVFEESGAPASPTLSFAVNLSAGPGDLSIIPLTTGGSFLLERQAGRGRVLLFASPPSPAAGEFIFSGIFAPLLFRSGAYVAGGSFGTLDNWEVGTMQHPVLLSSKVVELTMVTPLSELFQKQPRSVMGGVEYDAGLVTSPGVYRFEDNGTAVAKFSANIASGSGQLVRSNVDELAGKFKEAKVLDLPREQISAEITSARFGTELWRPIAAMFIGLLLAESIIGRSGKREDA